MERLGGRFDSPTVRERPNKNLVKTKRKTPQNPRKSSQNQQKNCPHNHKNPKNKPYLEINNAQKVTRKNSKNAQTISTKTKQIHHPKPPKQTKKP